MRVADLTAPPELAKCDGLSAQGDGGVGVVAEGDFHVLAVSEAQDGHVPHEGDVGVASEGVI